MELEQMWTTLKQIILETGEKTWNNTKNKRKKLARWWKQKIKYEVKLKNNLWREYLSAKSKEKYKKYKKNRE